MISSKRELLIAAAVIDLFLMDRRVKVVNAASEFQFLYYKRRADLVLQTASGLMAFEIKSKDDSLKNLNAQLSDYIKVFPSVYVVTEIKFISKVVGMIPDCVGIAVFDERKGGVSIVRRAVKNDEVYKFFYKSSIPMSYKSGKEVKGRFKGAVLRYFDVYSEEGFGDFLKHRGSVTHSEDLRFISSKKKETSLAP